MRRPALYAGLLALAGCEGAPDDPHALFRRFEEAWSRPSSLRVETVVRARVFEGIQIMDEDASDSVLLVDGDRVHFATRYPDDETPDIVFFVSAEEIVVVGGPQVIRRPIDRAVRRDLCLAAARAGSMGCLHLLSGLLRGEPNPLGSLEMTRLRWIGPDPFEGRDALVLEYNLRIATKPAIQTVCRVWIDPESAAPIYREFQGVQGGRRQATVEVSARFEPEAEIPEDAFLPGPTEDGR